MMQKKYKLHEKLKKKSLLEENCPQMPSKKTL